MSTSAAEEILAHSELTRSITGKQLYFYVVGDVLGSGIYVLVGLVAAAVGGAFWMAFLAGVHFWWPKMTGRMYPESLSKLAAVTTFIGFNLTFLPQFILGYLGMPRRYHAYPPEFQVLNVLSTAGATC